MSDLYSLIKFLRIDPLHKKSEWSRHIISPISSSKSPSAFAKLQILMKGITLRRTKNDMIDGKPILSLPERYEEVRYLQLAADERETYDKVHRHGKMMFDIYKASETGEKSYMSILQAVLLMRQACLHLSLVKLDSIEDDAGNQVHPDYPLSAEKAKRVYRLLQQADEISCILCGNAANTEGEKTYMTPCEHLYVYNFIVGFVENV